MEFKVIGKISQKVIISKGKGIKELNLLEKVYGKAKWRKLKGLARIQLSNGNNRVVELHWYEGHGIGKMKIKIKKFVD